MKHIYKLEIERKEKLTEEELSEVIDSYVIGCDFEISYLESVEE